MAEHTPGPWQSGLQNVTEDGLPCNAEVSAETEWVVDGEGKRICRLGGSGDRFTDELNGDQEQRHINEANAKLIAAAPALEAALEEIQSLLYSADNADLAEMKTQCLRKAFGIARAALEKARGK